MLKTIRSITTSALFRLGKNTSGRDYTWMEQVCIEYLSDKAPLEGNVSLKCIHYNIGEVARVVSVPPDCIRISRIALKSGNRVWTLTVDNNLAIPENVFSCLDKDNVSTDFYSVWPSGPFGWWADPKYTLGGGKNENYYRIVNDNGVKNIIFDHNIPAGNLIIEYFSNGANLDANSVIDASYAEPIRLYLMSEYCLHKGNREDKAKYKELQMQYEAAQWNANAMVSAPRLSELIDAMATSSEFNLG